MTSLASWPRSAPAALLALCLSAALAGCSIVPYSSTATADLADAARALNADLADASEAFLCRGMSIREWMLRYGHSDELAAAWATLCDGQTRQRTPRSTGSTSPPGSAPGEPGDS